jgi:hypothetical protein
MSGIDRNGAPPDEPEDDEQEGSGSNEKPHVSDETLLLHMKGRDAVLLILSVILNIAANLGVIDRKSAAIVIGPGARKTPDGGMRHGSNGDEAAHRATGEIKVVQNNVEYHLWELISNPILRKSVQALQLAVDIAHRSMNQTEKWAESRPAVKKRDETRRLVGATCDMYNKVVKEASGNAGVDMRVVLEAYREYCVRSDATFAEMGVAAKVYDQRLAGRMSKLAQKPGSHDLALKQFPRNHYPNETLTAYAARQPLVRYAKFVTRTMSEGTGNRTGG